MRDRVPPRRWHARERSARVCGSSRPVGLRSGTAAVSTSDIACLATMGHALATVPTGDCCDTTAAGSMSASVHPGASSQPTARSAACGGGYDWNCNGVIEQDALPHPATTTTPTCGTNLTTCAPAGPAGWYGTGGIPTGCGDTGTWFQGSCHSVVFMGVPVCRPDTESYTRRCR